MLRIMRKMAPVGGLRVNWGDACGHSCCLGGLCCTAEQGRETCKSGREKSSRSNETNPAWCSFQGCQNTRRSLANIQREPLEGEIMKRLLCLEESMLCLPGCLHLHTHTHTHTHTHAPHDKHIRAHTRTHAHTGHHAPTYTYTHAHTDAHMHTHPHHTSRTHTHAHTHALKHTRTRTHTTRLSSIQIAAPARLSRGKLQEERQICQESSLRQTDPDDKSFHMLRQSIPQGPT